jgi:endo-alpha-1,4-polygalactosaminidase (GH114 family)
MGKDSVIDSQLESVMKLGYDGIFFDETDRQTEESQNSRYKRFANSIHNYNSDTDKKLVIVNPGVSDESVCRMFEYADIVSVENHWDKEVPKCSGIDKRKVSRNESRTPAHVG